ncbi:MAG: hypothetical protein JJ855_13125 [Rhodospirillales bacterium]|nr:hypothetical protein [Rhodospirillales bacterium]
MTGLHEEQAALVKKSFIRILPHRDAFSKSLYDRLFTVAPEARSLFTSDIERQREKLVATLAFVVNGASDLDKLSGEVRALGRRHKDYGVEFGHYAILRNVLVDTLAEYLGDDFTPDVQAAWASLYDELAEAMTNPDNPSR